ncbi:unnamed protein product [Zymoseptoria tritici ST99CH_1E4]|uniref:Carrier domain-containing protein n=1 Tax=Zymoseptoria tritici ST99CH_1E4 TaxID=1276532 RepID=A0A2H1GGU8_ZYMTR|nr:unnamed protein product [Zymoseptoria tritici ST99CH_1E4]
MIRGLRVRRRSRWSSVLLLLPLLYFLHFHLRPAVYHSFFSVRGPRYGASANEQFLPPGSRYKDISTDLVIASVAANDVSWTAKLKNNIPNLNIIRYVSDSTTTQYRPPVPKGREALMYFTYIYDNYDKLPDISIFVHAEEDPWHIDPALRQSMTFALTQLDLKQVQNRGYFNLRISWEKGCPNYINTTKTFDESPPNTEEPYMATAFRANFGEDIEVPKILAGPCCSQFAVTRKAIQSRPREQYKHHMKWLMDSDWPDQLTGRTWEHMWPWLFKQEAVDCEVPWRSYCQMYGICFPGTPGLVGYNEMWEERESIHRSLTFWRELWDPKRVQSLRDWNVRLTGVLDQQLQWVLQKGHLCNSMHSRGVHDGIEAGGRGWDTLRNVLSLALTFFDGHWISMECNSWTACSKSSVADRGAPASVQIRASTPRRKSGKVIMNDNLQTTSLDAMATETTTLTVPEAAQSFSLKLAHHDKSYLPIDRFLTIDGLLKSHAAESEQKPLICYPRTGAADFEEHTAADIDRYTDAAVDFYVANGLQPADPNAAKAPVAALLATSSFEFVITIFALNRLGWTVLFLSTRLTAPAYARLLELADCQTLVVPEAKQHIIGDICIDRPGCLAVPILQRHDYRQTPRSRAFRREGLNLVREGSRMAWILHSSGSTGFPKPIFLSNLACLANFRKSFGLRAFCVSPLFHSHGLMELFRAFYTQAPMYLGNHSMAVTAQNLVDAIKVAEPRLIPAIPQVLQLLAEKEEGVQLLAKATLVLFGGSSCPDELGDRLVAQGVTLVGNYGCTETGQIMTTFRPSGDNEWQYFRLMRPVADHTLMDEIAPGVFECVGLDGLPSKGPSNSNPPYSTTNPENSFRTADLFTRHPDPKKSNYYKYLSRLDDRITLVNGEKVLPLPIEGQIRQDELVHEAAVFGYQRTVPGVLIFRSPERGTDLSEREFIDAIWPSIETANRQAETFSRIPKELIVVIPADVVYPKTDKGTFIRAQVYQHFAEEIANAYEAFDRGVETGGGSLQLDEAALESWLVEKFSLEFDVRLPSAETDIFSAGVDSLQTTRLWRIIKRDLDLAGQSLSQNIVFEKANVRQLAKHLYQLRTGGNIDAIEDEIETMRELIDRYSNFIDRDVTAIQSRAEHETEVVAVTGATGNLGAFIVFEMAQRPNVSEVWALVRAPDATAAEARLKQSLATRGIDLTDQEKAKLRAVSSDLSQPDLGLKEADLERLLGSLTCVVHSAWAVNFNLGVRSFEAQHIRGTHNLINLCLRSRLPNPANFFFCSSVSTTSSTPKPATIRETAVEDLSHAQHTGYGRSKLVTEHIVCNAMRQTDIYARVLRVGQLSGDTKTAYWNDTEAIALMVRSALTTGALPSLHERPSWLPVDLCAKAIAEISMSPSVGGDAAEPKVDLVYHILNPQTFSFERDLLPALQRCAALPPFEIVSTAEWLDRLENSEPDVERNPSMKLVDFWRAKYGNMKNAVAVGITTPDEEPAGLTFDTARTVQDSPLLGTVNDPVSDGLIERVRPSPIFPLNAIEGGIV